MATKFLEPGGDADFLVGTTNGFWTSRGGSAVATDYVHGNHINSIKYRVSQFDYVNTPASVVSDSGSRISYFLYMVALPTAQAVILEIQNSSNGRVITLQMTTGGVLKLCRYDGTQIGTNGSTLSTGQWYRISLAYTITSTTVNRFEQFINGVSSISITNASLAVVGTNNVNIGNRSKDSTLDIRTSDHYIDDSSSLTDTGEIWVTAKRPVSNGTTNGFTTQIGASGSGYGSGNSPQVNERPLSITNGWSMVGAGSAITEEYNIESKSVGDIDISSTTIIDWVGWVSMKSLVGETVQMILNGSNVSQAITSTTTLYTKIKGSSVYPSGSGADIGIITDTTLTTVSLYECGVLVAYNPTIIPITTNASFLLNMI